MERPFKDKDTAKVRDMLGRAGVFQRKEAQDLFLKHLVRPVLSEEEIPVSLSLRRIVSRDILSPVDLPEFARSTMDGYAVRSVDTFGVTESLPAYLNLAGEVPMGAAADMEVNAQEVVKIATGGMLPRGADAVVMFEHTTEVDDRMIEVNRPVASGENVIQAGEDIRKESVLLGKGHRIRPQDIGALCGVGMTTIRVFQRIRAAVIPTGNEIILPDQEAGPGQVRDINSFHLCALLEQLDIEPVRFDIVPDEEEKLKEAILKAVTDTDMVLLSGGSSVGTRDLTAKVIADLGEPGVLVHGVAVKPGKPTLCAIVKTKPVIGLPGHPAAVAVGFDLFVRPVLQVLSGEFIPAWRRDRKKKVWAKMTRNIASSAGREDHVRVALEQENEELLARPVLGKSGLIFTLVHAVGTVVVPENKLGLEKGEDVEVQLFEGSY